MLPISPQLNLLARRVSRGYSRLTAGKSEKMAYHESQAHSSQYVENNISDDKIKITLNHLGEDYEVEVDQETANILLNEPDQADHFMNHMLGSESNKMDFESDETSSFQENNVDDQCSQQTISKMVWHWKGAPSKADLEAAELLLKLYEKYQDKFNDQKTNKNYLWQRIASEISLQGYYLGDANNAWVRCRQKFKNLQKSYISFSDNMKGTGKAKKDPPLFYDILHGILGVKHKSNPSNFAELQDSHCEDTEENVQTSESDKEQDKESANREKITNRFQKREPLQTKSVNMQILEEMKKQSEVQQKNVEKMNELLQEQNNQRAELIGLLTKLVNKN